MSKASHSKQLFKKFTVRFGMMNTALSTEISP